MHICCSIKWHQGHQNTSCGVYSHTMSTVQCNSTDPAARNGGLMMQFYDACHDNGEVEVVQCRQHPVPSKRKLKHLPYQKLCSWKAFLERGISKSPNRCGCEFIPITCLIWDSIPENAIRVWQADFATYTCTWRTFKDYDKSLKTVAETCTCSQQSLR